MQKGEMPDAPKPAPIGERTIAYSVRMFRLYRLLARDSAGRLIARRLLRSATSVGANAREAQAGQSRADFIAKTSVAHKEATQSRYWLRLIREACLQQPTSSANCKMKQNRSSASSVRNWCQQSAAGPERVVLRPTIRAWSLMVWHDPTFCSLNSAFCIGGTE